MSNKIESKTVNEIFINEKFEIPIYQRNYAWEEEQIEQLLEDIQDNVTDNQNYYVGNLIVKKIDTDKYSVIDGQQRLTTLFLLQILLNKENINKDALKFEVREKSNKTFEMLFNEKENLNEEDGLSKEILRGYNIIKNYFLRQNEEEANFIEKLNNVSLFIVEVPEKIDLNHYFEIMNTRGEQLELHEIAKSKFIEKIDKNNQYAAGLIWDACADMSSYVQMNFKKSIRENIFNNEWDELNSEIINFDKVCDKINENLNDEINSEEILTLKDCMISSNIKENKQEEKEENMRFESIIKFPIFLLQVAKMLNKSDDTEDDISLDDKKLLDTLENIDAKNFIFNLLKYRILFDKYIVKREYASEYKEIGKWSLKRLKKIGATNEYVNTYSANQDSILKLQSCLRITYTSPKTMHWIHILLLELNKNKGVSVKNKGVSVKNKLESYCVSKINKEKQLEKTGFNIDRIVFTYLDYILWRKGYIYKDKVILEEKPNNFDFIFRNSIEHFYPQNPENNKWDDENLNCFGNLALITTSANSKFSNILPKGKIETYQSVIEQSLKLQIMASLTNEYGWTKKMAVEHGTKMLELLNRGMEN